MGNTMGKILTYIGDIRDSHVRTGTKPKTMKFLFVASPLSTQQQGQRLLGRI
jgi:hypothetical protein